MHSTQKECNGNWSYAAFGCLKYWGQSVQRNGNAIRQVTDTAAYVVSYNLYLCTKIIIIMIIKQIIHVPLHFWQFHHAQAKNILKRRYHILITFLNLHLEKGGTDPLISSPDFNVPAQCVSSHFREKVTLPSVWGHIGESPYSCSVCAQVVFSENNFCQHMRNRAGERPYSCSVCGKSCSWKTNLTQHFRSLTGERPYYWSVCA